MSTLCVFKEIVHPKMKILLLITHPHVIQTCNTVS